MKNLKRNNKIEVNPMSLLQLTFSLCKECGACCFNCGNLDLQSGCTDDSHRLNTRCASFPVIYGNPKLMGHKNIYGKLSVQDHIEKEIWFLLNFKDCLLLQKELIFNNLRWILDDLNNGSKIDSFTVGFEDIYIIVNIK